MLVVDSKLLEQWKGGGGGRRDEKTGRGKRSERERTRLVYYSWSFLFHSRWAITKPARYLGNAIYSLGHLIWLHSLWATKNNNEDISSTKIKTLFKQRRWGVCAIETTSDDGGEHRGERGSLNKALSFAWAHNRRNLGTSTTLAR